jgi:hypothetical protein
MCWSKLARRRPIIKPVDISIGSARCSVEFQNLMRSDPHISWTPRGSLDCPSAPRCKGKREVEQDRTSRRSYQTKFSKEAIHMVWWWPATLVTLAFAPIDAAAKLGCVPYAPFRGKRTPLTPGLIISREQIAEDLAKIAFQCVRAYSVDN